MIRAAVSYAAQGLGKALLVGREERIRETAAQVGVEIKGNIEIHNARLSKRNSAYAQYLYDKLQRRGYMFRDCQRLINQDRNHFGAAMVATGDADALVTGLTRNYSIALQDVTRVIDQKPGPRMIGVSIVISRGRTVLVADTAVHEMPNAAEIAEIAIEAAGAAKRLGYIPRVALLSFSTFGYPGPSARSACRRPSRSSTGRRSISSMTARWAQMSRSILNHGAISVLPTQRPANVLIMPAFHSAAIATRMQELGGSTVIGPLLIGLDKPVQIVSMSAKDTDLLNMAALAAVGVGG